MRRPCPDCNGTGQDRRGKCQTCKGRGEWTCPFCGFREGQQCEQGGGTVPCFEIKDAA